MPHATVAVPMAAGVAVVTSASSLTDMRAADQCERHVRVEIARVRRSPILLVAAIVVMLSADTDAQPRVLSGFGATIGPEGYPRAEGPHQGVDLAAAVGTPLIAPANGVVNRIIADQLCGSGMVLTHGTLATVYCHLSEISVRVGQRARRGEALGRTGATGLRAGPGFEHLHFEMRDGPAIEATRLDPMPIVIGCFDASKRYPIDRLVLTYPLPCSGKR